MTFEQFAMMCARAMGATIPMRDDPMDAPFQAFMIDQLSDTIAMDCDASHYPPPVLMTGQQWLQARIGEAQRDIDYFTKQHAEEVARTEQRNTWLRLLRESLKSA
jgi:hypothetical protein